MNLNEAKFPFEMYSLTANGIITKPGFHNNKMEIVEVRRGKVKLQIGAEYVEATAGDFVYIPENTVFASESVEGEATIRGLIFDSDIIEANMESYETELLYMFYVQSENKINIFDKTHPVYTLISRCMNEAYEEFVSKDVCYMLPIRANIYLIMSALLRYYCGSKNELDKLVYHNVLRMKPAVDHINRHYFEKLYINDLSDIIMVSADYFTKMFKDSIGKTPVDYINGKRVNRAMQLLIETSDSMADIAAKVGFCNANYFHKIFKQYMDISPLAYRKRAKS